MTKMDKDQITAVRKKNEQTTNNCLYGKKRTNMKGLKHSYKT